MSRGTTIRRQLIVPLLAGSFAVIAGISVVSAWTQSSRARVALELRQDDAAVVLEEAAWPLTAAVVQQLAGLTGQNLVVWEPGSSQPPISSLNTLPQSLVESLRTAASPPAPGSPLEVRDGSDYFRVRFVRPRWQPQAVVALLLSQKTLDEARWNAAWPPAAIGTAAMLAVLPWLITLTGRWSTRLRLIQQQVAEIARGDAAPAVHTSGSTMQHDELAALLYDVESLAGKLQTLQQQLIRAEREQLVAQLVTGFAHQFRNGLSGISLALQVHQGRCTAPTDRSVEIAHRQLQLLETEVRGLLSLDKRAANVFVQLDLAELLRESLALINPALEHHNVTLHVTSPALLPVRGIRDSLRAAIVNLLQNAAEAAGPGGHIEVLLEPQSHEAVLTISDNGPGPTPEVAARMHEAFVTTKPEGLGLGLAIVTAAAQIHQGRLSWNREQHRTVMQLTVPATDTSDAAP